MNENVKSNQFKIGLYNDNKVVCEYLFDADCYNPITRYTVNIKDEMYGYLKDFKRILSKKNYEHNFFGYKLLDSCSDDKFKSNNFKLILFINDNTVVEREFSVYNYNKKSLFSTEVLEFMDYIKYEISNKLRSVDISMMWEDYDLINKFNMDIKDVRELTDDKRKSLLNRIYKN